MVRCHFCGGEIVKGKKNFSVARGDYCIIIQAIQTDICSQCGEAYYDPKQGKAIEEILRTMDDQVKKLQAPIPPTKS